MKAGRPGTATDSATSVVEAELSELDYAEAWRFSPTRRQAWRYWAALPSLTCCTLLLAKLSPLPPPSGSLYVGVALVWLTLALLIQESREPRSNWGEAVNPALGFGPVTLRFDADFLELESARLHYRLPWTELAGRVETPRSLLVYVKGGPWLLIPSWPWSAQQLRRLRAQVPAAAPKPPFDLVRFSIAVLMVVVASAVLLWACWSGRNA